MKQGKIQTLYDFETKEAVAPRTVLEAITGTGTEGQVVGFTKDNIIGAMNPPQTGITEEDADNRYLQLSGGTMTGALSVQEPTEEVNAVNKGYVDDALQRKSNPNLLDNWYFVNPINQRGQTEYTGSGYTIDRWRLFEEGPRVTLDESRIILTATQGVASTLISQIIDPTIVNSLIGKKITLSLLTNKGLSSFSMDVPEDANTYDSYVNGQYAIITGQWYLTFYWGRFRIMHQNEVEPEPIKLIAAKLELGSVQTIAHKEGDTWVLNDPPPDPALELTKCQRYQYVISTQALTLAGIGLSDIKERAVINMFLPVSMRALPTAKYAGRWRLAKGGEFWVSGKEITSMVATNYIENIVTLQVFAQDLVLGETYVLSTHPEADIACQLILDANL